MYSIIMKTQKASVFYGAAFVGLYGGRPAYTSKMPSTSRWGSSMRATVILLALLCTSVPAFAGDEWDFSMPHKNRCSDGGQLQMNECLAGEFKKVDAQLNADYKRLLAVLENPSKLKKAQSAWLRFRDADCEYASSGLGQEGSLSPFAQAACFIDLTEKRIRDLHRYIEWDCNGCPPRK